MNSLRQRIASLRIPEERILENEPMSRHTSFRVGGKADFFVDVAAEQELAALLALLTGESVPHLLIGNGSDLLFADEGYRGVILHLTGEFENAEASGEYITAGSARLLSSVSSLAAENGLTGMEFASGIPGSLGGAVFMNAGAYGGEMKDIVSRVWVMAPDGSRIEEKTGGEMDFSYRHSAIQDNPGIVTRVELKLTPGDPAQIRARIRELTEKRNAKQPVNYPSAGSTFKRPSKGYAAALIEEAGLKGVSVGGAEVSEKHSGFIINKGGATASDVLELMRLVRARVYEHSGILLEPEVRIIGGSID